MVPVSGKALEVTTSNNFFLPSALGVRKISLGGRKKKKRINRSKMLKVGKNIT